MLPGQRPIDRVSHRPAIHGSVAGMHNRRRHRCQRIKRREVLVAIVIEECGEDLRTDGAADHVPSTQGVAADHDVSDKEACVSGGVARYREWDRPAGDVEGEPERDAFSGWHLDWFQRTVLHDVRRPAQHARTINVLRDVEGSGLLKIFAPRMTGFLGRGENRNRPVGEELRQGADVIDVRVRDEYRLQSVESVPDLSQRVNDRGVVARVARVDERHSRLVDQKGPVHGLVFDEIASVTSLFDLHAGSPTSPVAGLGYPVARWRS